MNCSNRENLFWNTGSILSTRRKSHVLAIPLWGTSICYFETRQRISRVWMNSQSDEFLNFVCQWIVSYERRLQNNFIWKPLVQFRRNMSERRSLRSNKDVLQQLGEYFQLTYGSVTVWNISMTTNSTSRFSLNFFNLQNILCMSHCAIT